jgi:hypothetical protein
MQGFRNDQRSAKRSSTLAICHERIDRVEEGPTLRSVVLANDRSVRRHERRGGRASCRRKESPWWATQNCPLGQLY